VGVHAATPELARVFEYDFGAWERIMDVGGGNGILLSHILRTHKNLRGVLADQSHVLACARKRGFLDLALAARTAAALRFLRGTLWLSGLAREERASRLDDSQACEILVDCRRAVPANGPPLASGMGIIRRKPSIDLVMLARTGGKQRPTEEYGGLLAKRGLSAQ
jgi:hypothetical protein